MRQQHWLIGGDFEVQVRPAASEILEDTSSEFMMSPDASRWYVGFSLLVNTRRPVSQV